MMSFLTMTSETKSCTTSKEKKEKGKKEPNETKRNPHHESKEKKEKETKEKRNEEKKCRKSPNPRTSVRTPQQKLTHPENSIAPRIPAAPENSLR